MTSPSGHEEIPGFIQLLGALGKPAVGLPLLVLIFGYGAYRAWHKPEHEGEVHLVRGLRAVDRGLAQVESVLLAGLLVFLIFVATYQAYKRNYAPPSPFYTDELIRYAVFAIGMLGAALATQTGRLINADLFSRTLSGRLKIAVRVLTALFTIGMAIMLVRGGWHVRTISLRETGEVVAPSVGILPLPVGAALIGIHLTLHSLCDLYYLVTGKPCPESAQAPV